MTVLRSLVCGAWGLGAEDKTGSWLLGSGLWWLLRGALE